MSTTPLNTAVTGMQAMETQIAVISNNLANMNTTGYKRLRAEFHDLMYQTVVRPGAESSASGNAAPSGVQIGHGVQLVSTYPILDEGDLLQTTGEYDLAINGNGYFKIQMPDGTNTYTRSGSFRLNDKGQIVTGDTMGNLISPTITVPQGVTNLSISADGLVHAIISGNATAPQLLGQIDMVDFPNASGLQPIGNNLYSATDASGNPIDGTPNTAGMGQLMQGWLETSNVSPTTELTNLITAQRGYELCSNVIKTADEMMQTANRIKA